jgi:hypothetical protein
MSFDCIGLDRLLNKIAEGSPIMVNRLQENNTIPETKIQQLINFGYVEYTEDLAKNELTITSDGMKIYAIGGLNKKLELEKLTRDNIQASIDISRATQKAYKIQKNVFIISSIIAGLTLVALCIQIFIEFKK